MESLIIKLKYFLKTFFIPVLIVLLKVSCSTIVDLPETKVYFYDELDFTETAGEDYIFFPDTKIALRTRYNNDSIRIWLRVADQPSTAALLVNGLTIFLDPDAKKKRNTGVIFPSASHSVIREEVERSRDTLRIKEESDTLGFDISRLVRSIKDRGAVIQMGERAVFAKKDQANIFVDENKVVNYIITFPFSALNIADPEDKKISVGVVSEGMPAPQPDSYNRQPGRTGPRDPRGYPQDRYPQRDQRTQQQQLKSFDVWMIFVLSGGKTDHSDNSIEINEE